MKTTDARRLKHEMLTELRKRGVSSVHDGQSPETVFKALGVCRATMYGWLARYRDGGWDGTGCSQARGAQAEVDAKAIQWVYKTVTEKNPLQLKFTFALWTAKMIGQLIHIKFGVKLSKASVCRLLAQLGLTPQRPVWRAYQQRPEEVQKWLLEDYPRIRRLAQKGRR
jgi:transposase